MTYEKATVEVVKFDHEAFMVVSARTLAIIQAWLDQYNATINPVTGAIGGLSWDELGFNKPSELNGYVLTIAGVPFEWEPNGNGSGKWNCTSWD